MGDEAEGIMLTSLNGCMWDLFKSIIQENDDAETSCDAVKQLAEQGLDILRGEAL